MDLRALASLSVPVVVLDEGYRCVAWSEGARLFFLIADEEPAHHDVRTLGGEFEPPWRELLDAARSAIRVTKTLESADRLITLSVQWHADHALFVCEFEDRTHEFQERQRAAEREAKVYAQLRAMERVSRLVSTADFEALRDEVVRVTREALALDRVDLWLFDDVDAELFDDQGLTLSLARTEGRGERGGAQRLLADDLPLLHMVRTRGMLEHEHLQHPLLQTSRALLADEARNAFLAGFFLQDQLLGLLVCQQHEAGPWAPETRTFLNSMTTALSLSAETTRRRETERRLQRYVNDLEAARARAEAADRAKGEFLAMMSHEIRTPMNGVLGFTGLLADTRLDDEQRGFLTTIKTSAEHLLGIINDILDFSKIDEGRLVLAREPFDLEGVVSETVELLTASAAAKGLWLTLELPPTVPRQLVGDEGRVRQVLLNLVSNAVKFTDRGGATVRVSSDETWVRLEVEDTGIGLAPADVARVGTRFMQADTSGRRRFGGTGLGLAIAHRLAQQLGAGLEVRSRPGEGSTFGFTLPRPARALSVVPGEARMKVALVDASAAVTQMWAVALRGLARVEARRADELEVTLGEADVVLVPEHVPLPAHSPRAALVAWGGRAAGRTFRVARHAVRPSQLRDVVERAALRSTPPPTFVERQHVASWAGRRVLLVEDNVVNQRLATRHLERLGCVVELACNGVEGVAQFQRGAFELVLMDCNMPLMDGLEATRAIRAFELERRRPPTPIVALTADAMESQREHCIAAGMNDHLTKPLREERLREVLTKFVRVGAIEAPA
ncbi:MAG: ATP-binding protein [Myxococcota bacterium]